LVLPHDAIIMGSSTATSEEIAAGEAASLRYHDNKDGQGLIHDNKRDKGEDGEVMVYDNDDDSGPSQAGCCFFCKFCFLFYLH
jgi:hypothetical protein